MLFKEATMAWQQLIIDTYEQIENPIQLKTLWHCTMEVYCLKLNIFGKMVQRFHFHLAETCPD